ATLRARLCYAQPRRDARPRGVPSTARFRSQVALGAPRVVGAVVRDLLAGPVLLGDLQERLGVGVAVGVVEVAADRYTHAEAFLQDRKSTRLNSSHVKRSYAVFCLKKTNYND